jgi:membrane protein YqaA with SNARE-associated domain
MEIFADPRVWALILILSLGGVLFSLPTYYVGRRGAKAVRERLPQIKEEQWRQAEYWFQRRGIIVLLLTAVPGFGTVLPPAAGLNGVRPMPFFLTVFVGKFIRYAILALVVLGGVQIFTNR